MVKVLIARQMAGKRIITNEGEEIGKLLDVQIEEKSGKLDTVIVEANPDNPVARKIKKADGWIYVPYKAVLAISDHIIIDGKDL